MATVLSRITGVQIAVLDGGAITAEIATPAAGCSLALHYEPSRLRAQGQPIVVVQARV